MSTTTATAAAVETPSGKDAAYENFPVGSWLLPARLRPHIAAFYAFARAIDDIADSPALSADDKIVRLEGFAAALSARGPLGDAELRGPFAKAHLLRRSLAANGITARHGLDLIDAFCQDALKSRYASWDELIDYCNRSAAPVGRFLLDLHGGSRQGYAASDALCNALQVINHLQDCADDRRQLDRIYLPGVWFEAEGARFEDLDQPQVSAPLRRVLDRCLDGVDALLHAARPLPGGLHSRRLALESAAILAIARSLAARLRAGDPLAGRIALGPTGYLAACSRGVLGALITRTWRNVAATLQ